MKILKRNFMSKPEKIIFQTAEFDDLRQVVKLKSGENIDIFDEWFNFDYSLNEEESNFLISLIKKHRNLVLSYSEEDLKMYFISNILNKVDFLMEDKRGYFDKPLKAVINEVEFSGKTDFMLAFGIKKPQKPYFFIQEFKQTKHSVDAEDQLLAEMLAAIELNKVNLMRGAFIVGAIWRFMILEKIAENSYQFFISDACDSLNFNSLKQIYICLQAIKLKYCV